MARLSADHISGHNAGNMRAALKGWAFVKRHPRLAGFSRRLRPRSGARACEQAVIAAHLAAGGEAQTLRDWFLRVRWGALNTPTNWPRHASASMSTKTRLSLRRASRPTRCILSWKAASAYAVLAPHTTIGRMGLITSQLRSATIHERKKRNNEPLAQALLTYVVSIMAE